MATLRLYQIAAPGAGVNEEHPDTMIQDDQAPALRNVRVRGGVVFKRRGDASISSNSVSASVASGPVLIDDFERLSGSNTALLATLTELFRWTGTAWSSILAGLSGEEDGYHSAGVLNDIWMYSNGIDHVKKWTGTGLATDLLGGSDYQTPDYHIARSVSVFADRVHLYGTNENGTSIPFRVRWSELNKTDEWNEAEGGGFRDLRDDPSGVQGAKILGNWNIVYCGNSIWAEQFVGGTTVMVFNRVVADIGTRAPRTIVDLGNFHIFMGDDDIYRFDGSQAIPIGGRIREELFKSVARDNFIRCHGALNRDDHLYYLYVPFGGTSDINRVYAYDYQQDTWVIDTAAAFSASAPVVLGTRGIIDELPHQPIDAMPHERIDALGGFAGRKLLVFADSSGNVFKDDGQTLNDADVAVDGWWESKDLVLDPQYLTEFKRVLEFLFEAKGQSVVIAYSTDHGTTWTDITEETLLSSYYVRYRAPVDITSRHIRFRFRNFTSNERFWLRWIGVKWLPAGEY